MSYRFVWNYIRRIEARLGKPVIVTRRGGTRHARRKGGGGTKLTPVARNLLINYRAVVKRLQRQIGFKKFESPRESKLIPAISE